MEDPSSAPDGPATSSTVWTTTNVGDARADDDDEKKSKIVGNNAKSQRDDYGNHGVGKIESYIYALLYKEM